MGLDLTFPSCKGLYGLSERGLGATSALRDTTDGAPYRLFNTDVFAYPVEKNVDIDHDKKGLYGSVPMLLARSEHQPLLACFWHNASDTFVDVATVNNEKVTRG